MRPARAQLDHVLASLANPALRYADIRYRLTEKLGPRLTTNGVRRGYSLYAPGDSTDGFTQRAIERPAN